MKTDALTVCIDANVYISGFAFGGKPEKVIDLALARIFNLATSLVILEETRRNLVKKLEFSETEVNNFLNDILRASSLYEPLGEQLFINHKKDSLVLETAILANADVLVTGDKKDLLPLKNFQGISIETPSLFLTRFPL